MTRRALVQQIIYKPEWQWLVGVLHEVFDVTHFVVNCDQVGHYYFPTYFNAEIFLIQEVPGARVANHRPIRRLNHHGV